MSKILLLVIVFIGKLSFAFDYSNEKIIVSYRVMTGKVDRVPQNQAQMCNAISPLLPLYNLQMICKGADFSRGIHLFIQETDIKKSEITIYDYSNGVRLVKKVFADQSSKQLMEKRIQLMARIAFYYLEYRNNPETLALLKTQIEASNQNLQEEQESEIPDTIPTPNSKTNDIDAGLSL